MKRNSPSFLSAFLFGTAALLLAACAGDGSRCALLPGGNRYCLQKTGDVVPFAVQQKVDVVFSGGRETIIAQVEADGLGMRFVGTTPFGQKLVQLGFDNERVTIEAAQMKGLNPVLLLALVQVALWPADRVRAGFDGAVLVVDEGEQGRQVIRDGRELVSIKYTDGRSAFADMRIQLPEAGVEFVINNLDAVDTQ